MKYIDTHAHYGHGRFKKPTDVLLKEMEMYCERIIQVGTNTKSIKQTMELIKKHKFLYGIIGYFPTDVWEIEPTFYDLSDKNFEMLVNCAKNDKIVGIGEIGLDYSWNKVGQYCDGKSAQMVQQKWFKVQLDLANEIGLPVSIHSRDAEEDTKAIFKEYELIPGVIHCFSYGQSAARIAIDKGLYLGIGGTSTYPSNKEIREVIKYCPMDRILLETDAPYLSPQQVRKEVNTSKNIQYVIDNIAEIKGVDKETVIEITNANAYELFQRLQ